MSVEVPGRDGDCCRDVYTLIVAPSSERRQRCLQLLGEKGLAVREAKQQGENQMGNGSSWTAGDDRSRTGRNLGVSSPHGVAYQYHRLMWQGRWP